MQQTAQADQFKKSCKSQFLQGLLLCLLLLCQQVVYAQVIDTTFAPKELDSKDLVVTFSRGSGKYAFDEWDERYENISLINNKKLYERLGSYRVPCKLVPPGKTDRVGYELNIVNTKMTFHRSRLMFKTGAGVILQQDSLSGEVIIPGGKANDAQDLYVLYPDAQGEYRAVGKLKVLSYPLKSFKVKLVPLRSGGQSYSIDPAAVQSKLDEVYGPLGITWEVTQDSPFDYSSADLISEGSDLLSTYSDEMKTLNSAYRQSREIDKQTVYLFVMNRGEIKGMDIAGDMPRGKQFGYLFTGNSGDLLWTAAHELGHGRFQLRHTFDSEYGGALPLNSTRNLMDYAGGIHLDKWQWDEIFSPAILVSPFEGDEEGMSVDAPTLKCISDATKLGKIFVAPGGQDIKLTTEQIPYAFFAKSEGELYGRLAAYKYNNKTYIYYLDPQRAYSGLWGWVGMGGQKDIVNLKPLTNSSEKGILVKIDDNCNYEGNNLKTCNCSFGLKAKKDPASVYTEGGRPTVVSTGDQEELPCIALPENQAGITVEYLKDKLYHKRATHCLEDLNEAMRKALIAKIAKQKIVIGADEDILFRLIFSTPKTQEDAVFTYLKDNDLISSILNKTQLSAHDEITFVFIGWLRTHKARFPVTDNTKVINYNKRDIDSDISGNKITFNYDWVSEMGYTEEQVGLYDYILVYFVDEVGGYKKGSFEKLPALEAYYLFNSDRRESLIKSGKLAIDAGLLALGVGEIAAAYRVYQAAQGAYALYLVIKASADMGVGLTDIVIQHSLAQEWSKTTEGKSRLERWNTICTWYTVGSLTASSVDLAIGKFGKTIDSESKFDEICDELEGGSKGGEEVVSSLIKKFDNAVEANVGENISKSIKEGLLDVDAVDGLSNEIVDISASKEKKLSWDEVKALFKRGNDFNKKAGREYKYNEIHLVNGKRLDSYNGLDEIVSRKATSLNDIKIETFEGYLKEMKTKYPSGSVIRSNKYPELDGKILQGKQILEIPASNQNLLNIQNYIKLAKDKYDIDLRFKAE